MDIQALTSDGQLHKFNLPLGPDSTVGSLVQLIFSQLHLDPLEDGSRIDQPNDLKLIFQKKWLQNYEQTLAEAGISNHTKLVVLLKRPEKTLRSVGPDLPPVTQTNIDIFTKHFSIASSSSASSSNTNSASSIANTLAALFGAPLRSSRSTSSRPQNLVGRHIRDVVLTLAQIGASIQGLDVPSDGESSSSEPQDLASKLQVDQESLNQLLQMGFEEEICKKALLLHRMSPTLAMEWILEHSSDPNAKDPLTSEQIEMIIRRKNKFQANPIASRQLEDMGFNKNDVYLALRASKNNIDRACNWLLGDRESLQINLEEEEEPKRLDGKNPIILALLSIPKIQIALKNPRVVTALSGLAADMSNISQVLNEQEISPVIIFITQYVQSEYS